MSLDPQTIAWLEQQTQQVVQNIRTHGVHLEYVSRDPDAEQPSLCYTVGLYGLRHPELLVLGTGPHTSAGLLNDLAHQVRDGRQLVAGELITFPDWQHRIFVEASPNPGEIAFAANAHYERPAEASVPLLQLTHDDKAGRFPWDEGYSIPAWVQPRPGTFRA